MHVSSTPREEMQGGDMVTMMARTCKALSALQAQSQTLGILTCTPEACSMKILSSQMIQESRLTKGW